MAWPVLAGLGASLYSSHQASKAGEPAQNLANLQAKFLREQFPWLIPYLRRGVTEPYDPQAEEAQLMEFKNLNEPMLESNLGAAGRYLRGANIEGTAGASLMGRLAAEGGRASTRFASGQIQSRQARQQAGIAQMLSALGSMSGSLGLASQTSLAAAQGAQGLQQSYTQPWADLASAWAAWQAMRNAPQGGGGNREFAGTTYYPGGGTYQNWVPTTYIR
jgi:hypothetical protein